MQMLYAAPEIADDWAIAPVPGFEAEDGTIHNEMPATDRSAIIFESSEKNFILTKEMVACKATISISGSIKL